MPEEGLLFVGDEGKILADFSGRNPRLIPKARMARFQARRRPAPPARGARAVDPRLPRHGSVGRELRKGPAITETILLGTIAVRVDRSCAGTPRAPAS